MELFADRAFVLSNGVEIADLESATVTRTRGIQRKKTMTRNGRDKGYTESNLEVSLELEYAIPKDRAAVDLALANKSKNVKFVFECGGERYTIIGVIEDTMTMNAAVGSSSKRSSLLALDIINENGASVNADIRLAA